MPRQGNQRSKRAKQVLQQLEQVPSANQRLSSAQGDWTTSGNTKNELTKVAEFQAQRPLAIREGESADVHFVAYEEFTTDGTASNTETFNLANDIIDADAIADDLVLFEGGSAVSADSVDYSANSFDYTDDGTANTLHAYYVVSDQALVDIRKVAPKNVHETVKELDAGFANRRDQREDPVSFDFDHPLQGVVPTDWKVEVHIDAPYAVQWADDSDSAATADNLLLDVPIRRARDNIEGLEDVVKATI